ncbi:CHAT domain-containing tetratricopeptide repeat protein [uncultured Aquimarina sp.]|uniref:CHAT domain-containing protein n=1 Tax=uncultured Aquimarina sp. TaxID=575652 RepID=UPI002624F55E|nr:CHAT domain-containing tetratricopeptide repeat protein [uncultured Aquimarina sp.]
MIFLIKGQGVSSDLDSINKLAGSNYEKIDLYYKILDKWKTNKDYIQLGFDAHQLAKWIHKEKKWNEAISIVKTAYKAREKVSPVNKELLKRSYYNYAIYNYRKKNYAEAITYFEKLIAIDDSPFLRGRAYELIGDCYRKYGDFHRSIDYQLKALSNHEERDIKKGYLIVGNINLAYTYIALRSSQNSKKAIKHLEIAEKLIQQRENHNKLDLYIVKNNFGNVYCEGVGTKNIEKCINSYNEALKLLQELKLKNKYSSIYYNLGLAHTKTDSTISNHYFKKALEYVKYDKALNPLIHMGIGIKHMEYNDHFQAQESFTNSFKYYFDLKDIDIYWLPKNQDLDKITDPTKFLELLKRRLESWLELSKKDDKYYIQGIKTAYIGDHFINLLLKDNLSIRTKLLWRNIASQMYLIALEATMKTNKYNDAFYFMEKSKALLLLQSLNKNDINLPPIILEKNKKLSDKIASLRSQLRSANLTNRDSIEELTLSKEAYLKSYRDSLSSKYPFQFTNYSIPKTISLSSLELASDEVVIQYAMGIRVAETEPEAYGLFISNNKKRLFKISKVSDLKNNIDLLRKLLNQPFKTEKDLNQYNTLAHKIYNSLFPEEIRNHINNSKITIVPDNLLHYIPFEALITDIKNKKYLIEKAEVNYAYSLSFNRTNSKIERKHDKDFLGIAPVEFSNNLTTLSKSKNELLQAIQYYEGDILLNDHATKKNFKDTANEYKILHLATHADASDSLNPWIAFRKDKLTELEIGVMNHKADLVIMSACSTSLGEIRQGEGVLSLARGFFKSGANTVIPTLWSTNDKATATITADFYKNLSEGQTKSAALRQAKLNYLHNNTDAEASPHYWASMILIGDTGTLLPQSNDLWMFLLGLGIVAVIVLSMFVYKRVR